MKLTDCGECAAFKIARGLTERKRRVAQDSFPATFEDISKMSMNDETKFGVPEVLKICLKVLPREMFDKVMRELAGDAYAPFMSSEQPAPESEAESIDAASGYASDEAIAAFEKSHGIPTRRLRHNNFGEPAAALAPVLSPADRREIDDFKKSIGDTRSVRHLG